MHRGIKRTSSDTWKEANGSSSDNHTVYQDFAVESEQLTQIPDSGKIALNKRSKTQDVNIPGFNYTNLQGMIEKDANDLVMHLTSKMSQFLSFLNMNFKQDVIMLVAAMLAKVSHGEMRENKAALLAHAVRCNIMEKLSSHSFDVIALNLKYSHEELLTYFENLQIFYQQIIDVLPNTAMELLREHSTKAFMALQNLRTMKGIVVPEELEKKYDFLMASINAMTVEGNLPTRKDSTMKWKHEWHLGVDFREHSIHPQPQDLLGESAPKLFPAVIKGPYKSVEHYLDIQFNLLRSDFMIPLRKGIGDFTKQSTERNKFKRVENVRFYRGVKFVNQLIEGDTLITEVLFNSSGNCSTVNWMRSKRLLYGSLLCFTSNLFRTIFLGVITERNVKLLQKGILRCKLIGAKEEENVFGKEFIMAESEIYFEAYQHVLRGLKNFNEGNFPLREYIINVSSEAQLPTYLARNPTAVYKYKGFQFPVVDFDKWPSVNELEVNSSQFIALHSALTRKCAIIQGPPGTGKTYIGLIIAKILLDNSSIWQGLNGGPILVVCFTNHALDQFLEGILTFTKNVVRVGGQSKNDNLNEYNLKCIRRKTRVKGLAMKSIDQRLGECASKLNFSVNVIKELQKKTGIISLKLLQVGMEKEHIAWFTHEGRLSDDHLVKWLMVAHSLIDCSDDEVEMDGTEPISDAMIDFYAQTLQNVVIEIHHLIKKANGKHSCKHNNEYYTNNWILSCKKYFTYLKMNLTGQCVNDAYLLSKLVGVSDPGTLQPEYRWSLYNHWLSQTLKFYQNKLHQMRSWHQRLSEQKQKILNHMNLDAVKQSDFIGMTTTGAAKNRSLLQMLGSKIVIVEEAAEALESHIIVSLTSCCEHLILIGDHKQLRPTNAEFKLAKDYHLDISLFERLLMNEVSFNTLKIQHRMRPDIAQLIMPAIYPELENHLTVMNYDNVIGLRKNLYFINHTNLEETAKDDLSKKNPYEAKFLIALCRHIILQGYNSSQITILTTYLGQLFCLIEEREKNIITKGVRIAVVDNYQGEENDIILLSLVRNNEEGKVGFLASENRTCVALSRAKKGLYIMGNLDMLVEKSHLWSQIKMVLQEKEAVGTHLTLQCVKHPEQLTDVNKAEDFISITEGGCKLMCGETMSCGHICKKMCHSKGHDDFKCQEICEKVMCIRDHRCQKLCWKTCGTCMITVEDSLPCGHTAKLPCQKVAYDWECMEKVSVKLPDCEHEVQKLCHVAIKDVCCSIPCGGRLLCGHACDKKCHAKEDPDHVQHKCYRACARKNVDCQSEHICQKKCFEECAKCTIEVKKKLPGCNHFYDMQCSQNPETIECHKPCRKKLDCGHECPRRCKDLCGGCPKMVKKEIPDCQHNIKIKCGDVPERHMCKEKCTRTLSCGHPCKGICGDICSANSCESFSSQTAKALCGHDVTLFCSEVSCVPNARALMERCEADCNEVLKCSHKCRGTCGQCLQGRIHVPCQQYCGKNLICGHECTVACAKICPPCKNKCFIYCKHSKCRYICGRPCPECKENCKWRCEHLKCSRKCSDTCDRPPCNIPCKKKLECGHECIGFCGEQCPRLCKICNSNELDEIIDFFGTNTVENARFVVLPDCNHVFESTGLDNWFSRHDKEVKMLQCPQCRTPVQAAHRYGNIAKLRFENVLNVKRKIFGSSKQARDFLQKSLIKLQVLSQTTEFKPSKSCIGKLQFHIKKYGQERWDAFLLNSLQARTQCVLTITEHFKEFKDKISKQALQKCTDTANLLIACILKIRENISPQEQSDFEGECMRFHLMMQLQVLENTDGFKNFAKTEWYKDYEECRGVIEDVKAFEKGKYERTNKKIEDVYKVLTGCIGLSKNEMKQIVSAINLHQGHWVLCPNGHIYVIANCGGAVTEGQCSECKERIGGTDHQLLHSNKRLQNVPEGL